MSGIVAKVGAWVTSLSTGDTPAAGTDFEFEDATTFLFEDGATFEFEN